MSAGSKQFTFLFDASNVILEVAMNEKLSQNDRKMPVLFIGHGSPMNIMRENRFTQSARIAHRVSEPNKIQIPSGSLNKLSRIVKPMLYRGTVSRQTLAY